MGNGAEKRPKTCIWAQHGTALDRFHMRFCDHRDRLEKTLELASNKRDRDEKLIGADAIG